MNIHLQVIRCLHIAHLIQQKVILIVVDTQTV